MFVIRKEQIDGLAEVRLKSFRSWMLIHLRDHFHPQLEQRTDDDLREMIDDGLQRGRAFGLELQSSLCRFIDLGVLFGPGFEEDRSRPWVERAWRDPRGDTPDARVTLMTSYAVEWLSQSERESALNGR